MLLPVRTFFFEQEVDAAISISALVSMDEGAANAAENFRATTVKCYSSQTRFDLIRPVDENGYEEPRMTTNGHEFDDSGRIGVNSCPLVVNTWLRLCRAGSFVAKCPQVARSD